jgi:hypothetical protein
MKITQNETFKRVFNKKIILGVLTILMAAVFIGITSFVPFLIKPENIGTAEFWTNELIIVAITILALFSALFVGQASNAQNPQSQLARAKVRFVASRDNISNRNAFCQWIKKVLQPRDIQAIKERELRILGIDDYTILKLEDGQIKSLAENPQKFNDRYYSQLDKRVVEAVLALKEGVKRIKLVEPGYYLTVSSIDSDKTISEKSGREQKVKTIKLIVSVLSKIILTLIPAMIMAMFVKEVVEGAADGQAAEAAAKFTSRMFALVSSAFYGYFVGCQTNDIDADYINLKSDVHKDFEEDKDFVAVDQQELAKQEFIERVKKENQEYSKSLGFNENPEPEGPIAIMNNMMR